jgi:hypothetical protein
VGGAESSAAGSLRAVRRPSNSRQSFMFESIPESWVLYQHPKTTLLEAVLFVLALCIAITYPRFGHRFLKAGEEAFSRIAQRKTLSLWLVAVVPAVMRVMLLPAFPPPQPAQEDEFAHLYAGATFAQGRLANASPPLARHFESPMVLSSPNSASAYPPGQGFTLALGILLGHPWIGVLLGVGAMCAAILWMLQAHMPAKWALLGAVLAAMQIAVFSYWVNSYYGGAVAAIGGALVLGSLQRMRTAARPAPRHAALFVAGVGLLAVTRPFEGFILVACASLYLGKSLFVGRTTPLPKSIPVVLAGGALVVVGLLLFYNSRVTGDPLTLRYSLSLRDWVGFVWQKTPPENHCDQRDLHGYFAGLNAIHAHRLELLPYRWVPAQLIRVATVMTPLYISAAWAVPFILGVFVLRRNRRLRYLMTIAVAIIAGTFFYVFVGAHYFAPLACIVFAIAAHGIRYLRTWRFLEKPSGLFLSRAIPVICFAAFCMTFVVAASGRFRPPPDSFPMRRAYLLDQLKSMPGKHLVFVRYPVEYNFNEQWVHNEPDVENSSVIWAREMDPASDADVIQHYGGRRVWLLRLDVRPLYLQPYAPRTLAEASELVCGAAAQSQGTPATRQHRHHPSSPEIPLNAGYTR